MQADGNKAMDDHEWGNGTDKEGGGCRGIVPRRVSVTVQNGMAGHDTEHNHGRIYTI